MASSFYDGLELPLRAKLVSTNDRPPIFSLAFGIFQTGTKTKLRRILHDPIGGTPRHICIIFPAIIEDLTCA